MYGLVNAAFRELVISRHGTETWDRIRLALSLEADEFARMDAYPDLLTYQMVQSGAAVMGIPSQELLAAFGEFWVTYTDREGYAALFDIAGDSLTDFLLSLDELHVRVGRNFPKLRPPSIRFDVIDRNTLRMHYLTSREGLCPFVLGLLRGLSIRFRTPLDAQELECRAQGADHCVLLLKLGEKRGRGEF
jgi:predicted hydrocarbon binding protein